MAIVVVVSLVVAAFLWFAAGSGRAPSESQDDFTVGKTARPVLEQAAEFDPVAHTAPSAALADTERTSVDVPAVGGDDARAILDVRVVSNVHGGPVDDVEVKLYERGDFAPGDAARREQLATSDHEGRVRFEADSSVLWGLSVRPTDDHGYGSLDVEPLAPGERREVEFPLSTAGDVTWFGRVTLRGEPFSGARVRMLDLEEGERVIDEVESDATGLVQFAGSSWRGLDARVDVPGVGLTVVEITAGHETPELAQELPLWPVATMRCVVVDPAATPIPGIDVLAVVRTYELRPPDAEHAYSHSIRVSGVTDASGMARLADVPAQLPISFELRRGNELLLLEKRSMVVDAGARVRRLFVIGGAGRISGRVESLAGPPLADVQVHLVKSAYSSNDALFCTAQFQRGAKHSVTTGAAGDFVFEDVPYGAWYVGTQGDGSDPEQYALAPRIELSAAEPTAEVTLRLERGLLIRGRVVGVDGEGAAGVYMHSWDTTHGALGRLPTDADGAFTFGPMPAGLYSVMVESPDTFVGYPAVEVPAGTEGLRFVLEPGLVLRGTVVDAISGAPIEVAAISAHAPASEQPFRFHGNVSVEGGRFELDRLPAGEIALKATTEDGRIGILRGIQVQHGVDAPDVVVRLHRGIPVRVRFVGEAKNGLAIQALQDGVAMTYIWMKPGETTTFWAMPGTLLLKAMGEGVVTDDVELVVEPGDHPEIVLGDDSQGD